MTPTLALLPLLVLADLPSFTDFDAEVPNSPPAVGGPHEPTNLVVPAGGKAAVRAQSLGIFGQPVELSDDDGDYVALHYAIPVQSGPLRIEATVSFADLKTVTFLGAYSPNVGKLAGLTANKKGELWAGGVQIGSFAPTAPFRVRVDLRPSALAWDVTIDPELDGFADDATAANLPFSAADDEVDLVTFGMNATAAESTRMVYDDIAVGPLNLGEVYCLSEINSSGQVGRIAATGSKVVDHGYFVLEAFQLPANEFGYFLASRTQGFFANPGGSDGNLCLAKDIARFVALVENTGPGGRIDARIDLGAIPTAVPSAVLAGESWNFQAWHRDGASSNFTSAIEVVFE